MICPALCLLLYYDLWEHSPHWALISSMWREDGKSSSLPRVEIQSRLSSWALSVMIPHFPEMMRWALDSTSSLWTCPLFRLVDALLPSHWDPSPGLQPSIPIFSNTLPVWFLFLFLTRHSPPLLTASMHALLRQCPGWPFCFQPRLI